MKRVLLVSPFRGNVQLHTAYARRAMFDSLSRNEAPFVSHLLYTQVLNDADDEDRRHGFAAAFEWFLAAGAIIVYEDYGLSAGMRQEIAIAVERHLPVIYRTIGKNPV